MKPNPEVLTVIQYFRSIWNEAYSKYGSAPLIGSVDKQLFVNCEMPYCTII